MTRVLLMIIALISMVYCTSGQDEATTHYGYRVVYHKHGDGPKADTGYIAKVKIDLKMDGNDSLVIDPSIDPSQVYDFEVISPQKNKGENPFMDVLPLLRVGDSVSVYQNTDSIPGLPQQLKEYDYIKFIVSLTDVVSIDDHTAELARKREEQQRMMKEFQAREADVASLVAEQLKAYKAGTVSDMLELDSGLKIQIIEKGTGDKIERGEKIETHYYGVLQSNGNMFDNSFQRGTPISFSAGSEMIEGWNVGIPHLNHGDKVIMYIPYMMAYGEQGRGETLPAKSDLAFYIEIQ